VLAAMARAAIQGRPCATVEDVQAVAAPVFRHRLVLNFNAEADRVTSDELVRRLIEIVPRTIGA
jgi:MoxR-like ATPase